MTCGVRLLFGVNLLFAVVLGASLFAHELGAKAVRLRDHLVGKFGGLALFISTWLKMFLGEAAERLCELHRSHARVLHISAAIVRHFLFDFFLFTRSPSALFFF